MDVEIEGVGDGKVPVVNDQHVADVDLDLDEVCLQPERRPGRIYIHIYVT